jgi:hypothetical protein
MIYDMVRHEDDIIFDVGNDKEIRIKVLTI